LRRRRRPVLILILVSTCGVRREMRNLHDDFAPSARRECTTRHDTSARINPDHQRKSNTLFLKRKNRDKICHDSILTRRRGLRPPPSAAAISLPLSPPTTKVGLSRLRRPLPAAMAPGLYTDIGKKARGTASLSLLLSLP
jgi:hypothetical protein